MTEKVETGSLIRKAEIARIEHKLGQLQKRPEEAGAPGIEGAKAIAAAVRPAPPLGPVATTWSAPAAVAALAVALSQPQQVSAPATPPRHGREAPREEATHAKTRKTHHAESIEVDSGVGPCSSYDPWKKSAGSRGKGKSKSKPEADFHEQLTAIQVTTKGGGKLQAGKVADESQPLAAALRGAGLPEYYGDGEQGNPYGDSYFSASSHGPKGKGKQKERTRLGPGPFAPESAPSGPRFAIGQECGRGPPHDTFGTSFSGGPRVMSDFEAGKMLVLGTFQQRTRYTEPRPSRCFGCWGLPTRLSRRS